MSVNVLLHVLLFLKLMKTGNCEFDQWDEFLDLAMRGANKARWLDRFLVFFYAVHENVCIAYSSDSVLLASVLPRANKSKCCWPEVRHGAQRLQKGAL